MLLLANAVPTTASVVSRTVFFSCSCAFCRVLLGVSLAALWKAWPSQLRLMVPRHLLRSASLIASHGFFATCTLLIASLAGCASLSSCSSESLVIAHRCFLCDGAQYPRRETCSWHNFKHFSIGLFFLPHSGLQCLAFSLRSFCLVARVLLP